MKVNICAALISLLLIFNTTAFAQLEPSLAAATERPQQEITIRDTLGRDLQPCNDYIGAMVTTGTPEEYGRAGIIFEPDRRVRLKEITVIAYGIPQPPPQWAGFRIGYHDSPEAFLAAPRFPDHIWDFQVPSRYDWSNPICFVGNDPKFEMTFDLTDGNIIVERGQKAVLAFSGVMSVPGWEYGSFGPDGHGAFIDVYSSKVGAHWEINDYLDNIIPPPPHLFFAAKIVGEVVDPWRPSIQPACFVCQRVDPGPPWCEQLC